MTSEQIFRWVFFFVFVGMFLISGYFRRRARQSGEVISRLSEGRPLLIARMLVAAPLFLSFVAYIVNPRWMEWSSYELPTWLRWLAVIVSVGFLPLLFWVMVSIGKNVSETFMTKEMHELVTHGPYRWVRHPLYAVATGTLVSLSIVAGNWFMMTIALIALAAILVFVIPREEAELVRKFGNEYRQYQKRTGRLTPRLLRRM
jgi:protein-S-isoprenylcysteine O-methyltransferase Ste14